MTISTESTNIADEQFRRFVARFSENHTEVVIKSALFTEDYSLLHQAYLLQLFSSQIVSYLEHAPKPG